MRLFISIEKNEEGWHHVFCGVKINVLSSFFCLLLSFSPQLFRSRIRERMKEQLVCMLHPQKTYLSSLFLLLRFSWFWFFSSWNLPLVSRNLSNSVTPPPVGNTSLYTHTELYNNHLSMPSRHFFGFTFHMSKCVWFPSLLLMQYNPFTLTGPQSSVSCSPFLPIRWLNTCIYISFLSYSCVRVCVCMSNAHM